MRQIVEALRRGSEAGIVLGGVGFSVAPEAAIEFCGGDFGIAGEGEHAFVGLLAALENRSDVSRVSNLIFRENGSVRRNPSEPVDLVRLPPRRRGFVDNRRYFREGGQAGFETKRGCPMRCIYCADPVAKGRTVRLRPPAAVVAELSALLGQGIDHLHTCDCEFNLPREHAVAVCKAIVAAGLGDQLRWYADCAPTPFDDEFAGLFRRAGGVGIDFGADSGCDAMLRRLGRHFTTVDLANTAAICRRHGLAFMYDLLLGGPGETLATARETIDLMRRVGPDCVGLSLGVRVYDGTPVAEWLRKGGDHVAKPDLYGMEEDNATFLKPAFYFAPGLGADLVGHVRAWVGGDARFLLPEDGGENQNYNYNGNTVLLEAIKNGARGAYWDILRRLRTDS